MGSPEVDRVPDRLKRRWPDIRPADLAAVAAVLERGVLGGVGAPEMTTLESEWAAYVGRDDCLLFNSGTAAIHAALYGIGVGPGDEVITTSYTFAGTWQPILHQGAVPVFVDIDRRSYNLDPRRVEAAITPRTRAIIAVHIGGLPADLDELVAITERHGLYLIEDACQAHGATYHGRQVGSFGVVGCYSLNSSKILSGGEGGLLVADDPDVLARARRLRVFGEDIPELQKLTGWNFRPYTSHSIGWNYRHQEMPAALARSQLQRLPEYIETGQRNAAVLDRRLAEIPGLTPPHVPDDRTSSYYQYRVRLEPAELGLGHVPPTVFRDALGQALMAAGVGVELWHTQPAPAFPVFQERGGYDLADYPEAIAMLDSSLVICEARYPIFVQPLELIEAYAEGIRRTIADPERFLGELATPPPVPA
ncbi:MAG TPA: DegT/DnrJ/EryC1/StrS family aminotransferase [Candidatus Limnocylindrales bacterium]